MNNNLAKIFDKNWFFVALICFVAVLPFSQALVSILSGALLFAALVEDNWENKLKRVRERRILFLLPAIFIIYLLSSIITWKASDSFYDLKKNLFFLVVPLAFIFGKNITDLQKRMLFYLFALAVFISTVVALLNWWLISDVQSFEVHRISLISHIRFSFQLILVFWFLILLVFYNRQNLKHSLKLMLTVLAIYFFSFLIFQQSLTGLIAFGASLFFYLIYSFFKFQTKYKTLFIVIISILLVAPVFYVFSVIHSFYKIEKVDKVLIDKTTARGNPYEHNFNDPMVENGKYVNLYICHNEMRTEWNKISEIKYDSICSNGFPLYTTLIRYLTSKGLRKDADGVLALNRQDVENVENGIANVIFQSKKYTLFPRIYQTVWEYYVYSKTGNANHQSFSQRIEFSKAAINIIKNNFWLGVGTGNWKEEFRKTYIETNSKLDENLYASSHNQYLNYMVKFGIVGFILIMGFLILPVIKTRRYRDSLFLIFLVYLSFANFSDSNFESHMGSSFFVVFYCIFLISGSLDYLKIQND